MIGFYLVVTQPVCLLLSPWFSDMTLSVRGNKTLRIAIQNLGDASYFVQSMKVNEQAWNKSWLSHSDIVGGRDSARLSLCSAVRRGMGCWTFATESKTSCFIVRAACARSRNETAGVMTM